MNIVLNKHLHSTITSHINYQIMFNRRKKTKLQIMNVT